jgi:hypothetical protein
MVDFDWSDIGSDLVGGIFEVANTGLNAGLEYLTDILKKAMTITVPINSFFSSWTLIIYLISMFYGLVFIYIGYTFMTAGDNIEQRVKAKILLKNFIMIVLAVQMSFFIYGLIIDLANVMTVGVFNLIDPDFFLISLDGGLDQVIEFLLGVVHALVLLANISLVGMRLIMCGMGVIIFPVGLIFYFIPFLRGYGKFILSFLMTLIFMPMINSFILFSASVIWNTGFLGNSLLFVISAFSVIIFIDILIIFFVVIKSALAISSTANIVKHMVR